MVVARRCFAGVALARGESTAGALVRLLRRRRVEVAVRPPRLTTVLGDGFTALLLLGGSLWAETVDPGSPAAPAKPPASVAAARTGCKDCHDAGAGPSPESMLRDSVHRAMSCEDCHSSITLESIDPHSPQPHGGGAGSMDGVCEQCHEDAADVYQKHGRLSVGTDPDIPRCWGCHGAHDVLPSSDRQSHTHPINLPDTCRTCHTNVDLLKKHIVLRDKPIELYQSSVHGQARRKGLYLAANCDDCHAALSGDGSRTAHRVLSPADRESTIYHFNIPNTCGRCHKNITRDYWEGIHGQLAKLGSVDAPVCTHCHGEHGIISPDDPKSPVSAIHVAEQTCSPCHESAVLNEKYGLAGGRLASYIDSYHGLKSKAGDTMVANCASCHGAHRILPSTDPTSSIHARNLRATCGECHPNITAELSRTSIHEKAAGVGEGWPEFFRKFYLVLIVVVIGGMLLHNGADWIRYVINEGRLAFIQRLSGSEVIQHWVLMISFVALVLSGFSLRFSEAGWVQWLFGWQGGFEVRGVIHRAAAAVMVFGAGWHAFYLLTGRGQRWFRDMTATREDLTHVGQNILHFLGRRKNEPDFGRFSYMEKLEYWALVWGTAIMILSGLLLWFDNYFVGRWGLPKVVLDCALVIHYYEAWLATLAILVWHLYATVFKPSVYPMNPAWIRGRMPLRQYTQEHPSGPRRRSREAGRTGE